MKINVFNHGKSCHADGVYNDGKVTVLKGSRIFMHCNNSFSRYADVLALRDDRNVVDSEGMVIADTEFKNPSAAAVFVAGSSRNGNDFWKLNDGMKLGDYLEGKGLIVRKKRSAR